MKAHYADLLAKTFEAITRDISDTDTAKLFTTITVQMHNESPQEKLKVKNKVQLRQSEILKKFLTDNITDDDSGAIQLNELRLRFKDWNKYQPCCSMTPNQLLTLFDQKYFMRLSSGPLRYTGLRLLPTPNP